MNWVNFYGSGNYKGAKQDYKTAFDYFLRCAKTGDSYGMCKVGDFYAKGYCFESDYMQALKWYKKSMNMGNDEAKEKFEELYEEVTGEKTNKGKA